MSEVQEVPERYMKCTRAEIEVHVMASPLGRCLIVGVLGIISSYAQEFDSEMAEQWAMDLLPTIWQDEESGIDEDPNNPGEIGLGLRWNGAIPDAEFWALVAGINSGAPVTYLCVANQPFLKDWKLMELLHVLPRCILLKTIVLEDLPRITDRSIVCLTKQLERIEALQRLTLDEIPRLTDKSLQKLSRVLPSCNYLKRLWLVGFPHITDTSLKYLANALPRMPAFKKLWLGRVPQITDDAIVRLAKVLPKCPNLKKLSLGMLPRITDAAMTALANAVPKCYKLREMGLMGLDLVTEQGRRTLLALNGVRGSKEEKNRGSTQPPVLWIEFV